MGNWAAYILATAALLWSHYFGVLVIAVQQVIFVVVLVHRRRSGQPVRALALGFAYSAAILAMQLVPLAVFAHHQYQVTTGAAGSPSGTYDALSFYAVLANMAWALWGYQPNTATVLLAAMWPLFLLVSLLLLGRGGSRRTMLLGVAAFVPVMLLVVVSAFDRSLFEVRHFLLLVPAGVLATLFIGLADQQTNNANPRLFDFRTAIRDIQVDAGPNSLVLLEPADLRYVLEYYAPQLHGQPLTTPITAAREGSPVFVLTSFQGNHTFFKQTNKVVGQLSYFRRLVRRFKTPQTLVWEFG
jgi:hypothetical protein